MTSGSGIPRPFSITDAKRAREEEARKREQATSARNTSSTTIGSGGRLDVVGGDLTISDGGNAAVKDGGRFLVEGGGSMEITDDGVVKVVGSTVDDITNAVMVAEAALSTEEIHHTSSGVTTRSPGLFFKTERFSGGKVSSFWGDDVSVISGKRLVDYGPLVEPGVYKSTSAQVNPGSAGLYASAAFGLNPDFTDSRSQCYMEVYPDALVFELRTVALGIVGSINVSMLDPKLRLYGRDGVDVKGPFTVDGAPVGGAVDSVAGKTGAVTLVKADVGLGNVDNTSDAAKPVSTATQTALNGKAASTHTHTTAQVTGLDTALAGKASTNHTHPAATTTAAGFMSVTDKAILNAAPTKAYVDAAVAALAAGDWVTISAAAGWQPQAADPPKVKIINGVVYFAGNFQYIGAARNVGGYYADSILMGQLPAECYPASAISAPAMATWHSSGASTICRTYIGPTGDIRMYAMATNGVTTNFPIGSATYFYMSSVAPYPLT